MMPQFEVQHTSIENIIKSIKSGTIAIPEIQRPFVWKATQVRELMDSLYKGFPVGYITVWRKPDIKLKDGTLSHGKEILIDGQQRVTAIQAAIVGEKVVNADYSKKRIIIAFNPQTKSFEVANPSINKDLRWISDISEIFKQEFNIWNFVSNYCQENNLPGQESLINGNVSQLLKITDINLGEIVLSEELSIEDVTEIFIRINSQGVSLSQADFAMSVISADDRYGGNSIRKLIDLFCKFMSQPSDYDAIIENDKDFAVSLDHNRIKWVIKSHDNIYTPDYKDVMRVAFTYAFRRGKMAGLVSLLSGRDFQTRKILETIAEDSFNKLREGVETFVNENNFKKYIMIVRSSGIIDPSFVKSKNVLNFGYALYLSLRNLKIEQAKIENVVRRWIVLSILTGRYSTSPETAFDADIKDFTERDPLKFLEDTEAGKLSDAFWNIVLPKNLNTSVASSPYLSVYLMAQIKRNAHGFLSSEIDVKSLIDGNGQIHHVFPKKYLKRNGFEAIKDYNQIANYAYTQSEINIAIKDTAPCVYMEKMRLQVSGQENFYGGISTQNDLEKNLAENCIPPEFMSMNAGNYLEFLDKRRHLMAQYIRDYYESLN